MLFKPLPENIDGLMLQDHLFQTLKKNKLTQSLVNLRAEEIVKSLLKDSLEYQITIKYKQAVQKLQQTQKYCQRLKKQLEKAIEKQQKTKKTLIKKLKSQNQNILIQTNTQLQTKDENIAKLQQQLSKLEEAYTELQQQYQTVVQQNAQKSDEIDRLLNLRVQLEQKNDNLNKQLQEFQQKSKIEMEKILFLHQQQMDKNFSKIKNITNNLIETQSKLNQAQEENQLMKRMLEQKQSIDAQMTSKNESNLKKSYRQIEKLKKELSQSEQNYVILKKEITKFKDKYKKFEEEYNKMKQLHQSDERQLNEIIQDQKKEIQILNQKNQQTAIKSQRLSSKIIKSKKTLQKLYRYLTTSLVALKQQNLTLRSFLKQNFLLVKEYAETSVMKVVNHLSSQLSTYFQECVFQIKKARQQKNLAKQQVKMKTDLIEHLEKILDNETKSTYDLRYELKQKIKEQEKLRKKLKSHYQQTDRKLQQFQSKYISILKSEF